jgi:DNA-binding MarR family transcriptional regulator
MAAACPTAAQYRLLAAWRHALRRFLAFSHEAARAAGLSPQQYQALLALKGAPERPQLSVGELAGQLQLRHHSAVGLVDRLGARGLVRRRESAADGRRVELVLTAKGERLIARMAAIHLHELRQLGPEMRRLLGAITRA